MKEKSKKITFDYPLYDEISDDDDEITAAYLRVSTDTQAQEGYGLDVQYAAIKRYVEAYGIKNVFIFTDDGYTGMNEVRPAFSAMSKLMKEGRVKFVITYSLDRIGRTQMIILRFLKEQCESAKCDFYAVKDNVDSRSRQTYGILISILSIFAEFDHDAIISKLTSGRIQRAKEGFWKGGGKPPYGYRYSKKEGELIVCEEEAEKVKKVFDIYTTSGFSPKKIADIVGLSSDKAVFNILKNRIYIGEVFYRGESYKGRHKSIIGSETFESAQEILREKSVKRSGSVYLLSSLLVCGECGAKMRYMKWGRKGRQIKNGREKNAAKGDGELRILCYSYFPNSTKKYLVKSENCPNVIFDAEEIEAAVIESVMRFAVEYGEERERKELSADDITEGLNAKKAKLSAEYSRLVNAYRKLGDEDLLEQAAATKRKIRRIEKDIADEAEKKTLLKNERKKIEIIRTLPDTWDKMDGRTRQRIIRGLVEKIVVTRSKIDVHLRSSAYDKIPEVSLEEKEQSEKGGL